MASMAAKGSDTGALTGSGGPDAAPMPQVAPAGDGGDGDDSGKRRRGRPPGLGRVPGSGRKKGTANKLTANLKDIIVRRGRPLELLCDVAAGRKIRVGPQAGPGAKYEYPGLGERIGAAKALLCKIIPDLKANEITGKDGDPLMPPAAPVSEANFVKLMAAVHAHRNSGGDK